MGVSPYFIKNIIIIIIIIFLLTLVQRLKTARSRVLGVDVTVYTKWVISCAQMHGAHYLLVTGPVYILLSYAATQNAIQNPTHHDLIYLHHEYAVYAIPTLLIMSVLFSALSKPNYDVLFKRIALMGVLKSVSQLLTIQPQPGDMSECMDQPLWKLKACADMMFSGHTAFTYLVLYRVRYRWFFVFATAFELVLADWHFMADCFIAVIVAYAIEKKITDTLY